MSSWGAKKPGRDRFHDDVSPTDVFLDVPSLAKCVPWTTCPRPMGPDLRPPHTGVGVSEKPMDEGRERDKTSRGGGLPTLPGLYLSIIQPSQRGFFWVHMCVWRERKPEAEFLNFLGPQPRNWFLKGTVSRDFLLLVLFMNQFPPSPRVFH